MANEIQYGFYNLRNLFDTRVTQVGVQVVMDSVAAAVAEHNRVQNNLMSLFVQRTTNFQTVYKTLGTNRLQPMDEIGRALPVKAAGQYTVAWPYQRAGTKWGTDWETSVRMTVAEVNLATEQMLIGDQNWVRDHILGALYNNVSYSFSDEFNGALTILPLANGDAQTYPVIGGAAAPTTAQHFLNQAAGIADATNPYTTIGNTLRARPDNSGEVIALIPTNLVATTQALATFHPASDPNLRPGSNTAVLVGNLNTPTPGRLIGYVDTGGGVWVVEWRQLPNDRIIGVSEGGERPVAMREDPIPQLQGFGVVGDRDDFPWHAREYRRLAGFGTWNRVGAVVVQVSAGAYSIPTGYTMPMG